MPTVTRFVAILGVMTQLAVLIVMFKPYFIMREHDRILALLRTDLVQRQISAV